ncbi:MAG: site-specific integrase [Candidatus Omnitrophica bacterium]|nr:site-specific integrase [Candidatus Omnitrophota bacterium]
MNARVQRHLGHLTKKDALVSEFFNQFVEAKRTRISRSAWIAYRTHIRHFLTFCDQREIKRLSQITKKDVEAFMTWLLEGGAGRGGRKPKRETVNHELAVVRTALNTAVDEYLTRNPTIGIKKLKLTDARKPRVLNMEDLTGILKTAEEPFKTYYYSYITSGLRRNELEYLEREDIQFYPKLMFRLTSRPGMVVKDQEDRAIPLPTWMAPILRRHLNAHPILRHPFQRPDGKTWGPHRIRKRLKWYARRAKVQNWRDIRVHDLRHTYVDLLAQKGVDIRIIQALLGHSQVETTAIYMRTRPPVHVFEAVEKLKV